MSGGVFDYYQYRLTDIVERIEEEIKTNEEPPAEEYPWAMEEFKKNGNRWYSDETIAEFKKAIKLIKETGVYIQRIDWLLAGDDGENSFHSRLKEDLGKIENNKED